MDESPSKSKKMLTTKCKNNVRVTKTSLEVGRSKINSPSAFETQINAHKPTFPLNFYLGWAYITFWIFLKILALRYCFFWLGPSSVPGLRNAIIQKQSDQKAINQKSNNPKTIRPMQFSNTVRSTC